MYELREIFNGLRYIARAGAPWRMMPNDLPPWHVVYLQTQRGHSAGVFQAMVDDLRAILPILPILRMIATLSTEDMHNQLIFLSAWD